MLTLERLKEMLELQEKLEVHIGGENWRDAGHDYRLCIHMECAEIIDAYGWKHWKDLDREPDFDAISMEIVDIWHFGMAFVLMNTNFDAEVLYTQILEAVEEYDDVERTVDQLSIGLGYALYATDKFSLGNFYGLMRMVDMDFDDLYVLYISKNVLNWFRQDHGYKEGVYIKNWNGKEDNEHLTELIDLLGDDLNGIVLYDMLEDRYESV